MTLFFWLQFLAVCIIGAMSPGPSLALIIRNSLKFNRLSGILSAIGHGLGIGTYASLAIVGLHLILSSNIFLFNFIQVIGAVFLLLLGIIFGPEAPFVGDVYENISELLNLIGSDGLLGLVAIIIILAYLKK